MSLVNDMLRDLDARRREAPARGLGAEKLVPSEERTSKKSAARWPLLLIPVLVIGVLAVVWLLLENRSASSGQLAPVQFTPEISSATAPATEAANEELIAQAAAAAAAETMAQLESRLQQLEQQNQALLEAQQFAAQQPVVQPQLVPQPTVQQNLPMAQPSATVAGNQNLSAFGTAPPSVPPTQPSASDQSWADLPALPAEATLAMSPTAEPAAAPEPLTRSPRALSFEDQERLQVQTALQQWASGQRLTALQTLDTFTHENPQAHNARETLAKLLIQQGEPERAMQAAELGLAISPNSNVFRKIKARILLDQGAANDAVMLLSQNTPAVAADTEYHDVLATAYLANRQYDLAVLVYRALLQGGSTEGRWWYGLAAALDAQGYAQDAAQAYERALQQVSLSAPLRQTSQQRLQLIRQSSAAR